MRPASLAPLLCAVALVSPASAQVTDPRTMVMSMRALITANYVVADKRAAVIAALDQGVRNGRYDRLPPEQLARVMTDDMLAVANDKHLNLSYNPALAATLGTGVRDDAAPSDPLWLSFARRHNYGVSKLETLDGNIRVLTLDGFVWTGADSAAALDTAAAYLRGGDAIVIDLRNNGGGDPQAVRRLASYFVAAGTRLVTFELGNEPPTASIAEAVPGGPIGGKPVYVLTSGRTASAAEEFASHALGFRFAALVGEPTAGAAYRNALFAVPGGYVFSVSIGRPILPGGGDWEGRGVAPTIAADADHALIAARAAALARLATTVEPAARKEYEWLAAAARAEASPAAPALPLDRYVGQYGERSVSLVDGALRYRRGGGPDSALRAITPETFAIGADARTHVRFVVSDGRVAALEIERLDGSRSTDPRR